VLEPEKENCPKPEGNQENIISKFIHLTKLSYDKETKDKKISGNAAAIRRASK
jgi:hypothetical protein